MEKLELNLLAVAVGQENVSLCRLETLKRNENAIDILKKSVWMSYLELLGCHHVPSHPGELGLDLPLALHGLSVLLEVELQRLHVVVEAEGRHRKENVLAVNCLPLLSLTTLTGLAVKLQK